MHKSAGKAALWIQVNGHGQGDRKTPGWPWPFRSNMIYRERRSASITKKTRCLAERMQTNLMRV